MRHFLSLDYAEQSVIQKLIRVSGQNDFVMYLNSNQSEGRNLFAIGEIDRLEWRAEQGAFDALNTFIDNAQDWVFCYLTYDLKNDLEDLYSGGFDALKMPLLYAAQPRFVVEITDGEVGVWYHTAHDDENSAIDRIGQLLAAEPGFQPENGPFTFEKTESKEQYVRNVRQILDHIHLGDIYELNYCQEFHVKEAQINPASAYLELNNRTQAPFSCFMKQGPHYLLSGSPERFIRKQGTKISSQPIKGTIRRGLTPEEDEALKHQLANDPKEISENVMIVDLVRNDLSRTAAKGSVEVEELCGIYTFETVHQMISTVTSTMKDGTHPVEVIKAAFPMGSMTGAPKVRAMELIEQYESARRGLYSGAVGYFTPAWDFDFNVVIRSIIYNASNRYLSVMAGGAITAESDPEKEYNESMLKAEAMLEALAVPVK